ncbi:MAG: sigma-70 family RNA polymerase sigma factor [Candidatus Latescibacterota bacterium]|jgi:RNA polymerase sigma-70 factor (ECF subfamily)
MTRESLEESDLVARAQAGDRAAFGELVRRYGPLVRGVCRHLTGSTWDAEDLAHEALVEAWLRLNTLRDPACLAPWLRTLTLNLCRMWHRQRRRERDGLAAILAEGISPDREESDPGVDRLADGLARLSSDHRLALALHYGEGLTTEQIGAFLEVPPGTIMSRLHRARTRLKERMTEVADTVDSPADPDPLRRTVDAEIEVLLRIWEEEARGGNLHTVYMSPTCRRLGVLLNSSPELVRSVLKHMDEVLTRYVANRLRHAGMAAIGVAVTCALADEPALRERARTVLRQVLARGVGQANREPYFHLPSRPPATFLLDSLLRGAHDDAAKAELLVDLLSGCEDEATIILLGGVLLCFPDQAFPLLWKRWWSEGWSSEAPMSLTLTVLSRFGSRFLASLAELLAAEDRGRLRQALAGVQGVARLIGRSVLTRTGTPDPGLEWRVGGGLREEEIDPSLCTALCRRLASLVDEDRPEIREAAIEALGLLGGPDQAAALRPCLRHPELSTRLAAVWGLAELGDRACASDLLEIARHDAATARRAAVQALGKLRVTEARDLLIGLIQDPEVQPQAISALGELDDPAAKAMLESLTKGADKKIARLASGALYGGRGSGREPSATTRERLNRVRGEGARPLLHVSVVGAIRNLPEIRPYREPELTRFIGEICGDFSTTRRELVMDGLMVRQSGVYELTETGQAVWRVEQYLKRLWPGAAVG